MKHYQEKMKHLSVSKLLKIKCPVALNTKLRNSPVYKPYTDFKKLDLAIEADRGIVLHHLISGILSNRLKKESLKKVPKDLTAIAFNYIDTVIPLDVEEVHTEYRTNYVVSNGHVDIELTGYIDCWFKRDGWLEIIDWKMPGTYKPRHVEQIKIYTAMLMWELKVDRAEWLIYDGTDCRHGIMTVTERDALLKNLDKILIDSAYGLPSRPCSGCSTCSYICS